MDGRDATFLYVERPARQVMMPILFFGSDGELPGKAEILAWLVARAGRHRVLTTRMVRVPFDVDHPSWGEDPHFDATRHITFHDGVSWPDLRTVLARIAQQPLDMSRPLWEIHVFPRVAGLPAAGRDVVAVALRLHHAAADGRLTLEVMRGLFSAAAPSADTSAGVGAVPERVPSAPAMLARAARAIPSNATRSARAVIAAHSARKTMLAGVRSGLHSLPKATRPRTVLNQPLGPDRVFDVVHLSLAELKSLSAQIGDVTINDLVLTIVARALWAYLGEVGRIPSESLGAAVPLSNPTRDPMGARNQFVTMAVDLHNDVTDPIEQIRAIHRTVRSERVRKSTPESAAIDSLGAALPGFLIRGALTLLRALPRRADRPISEVNLLVSSVQRGPGALTLCDAVAVAGCSIVPLIGLGGVAHSASAVGDVFGISCTADPRQLSDLDRYTTLIRSAYEEIRSAVRSLPVNA